MKILAKNNDQTIIIPSNQMFKTDLGWTDNAEQMEQEILYEIINPIENYETVRYIHEPYSLVSPVTDNTFIQTDIWYNFYFLNSFGNYSQNYEDVGITFEENSKMLKQSTESFFRLEFYKTNNDASPNQTNRRLVFAKNLSLPLGEKIFYTGTPLGALLPLNDYVFVPVFTGSNYRNTENMYFFWFADDSPFEETNITGNTFYMTAKYYNAKDGSVIDFVNKSKNVNATTPYVEEEDVYYKVIIDRTNYSYIVYAYNGSLGSRKGTFSSPINFYERKQ
jgi:hypothetical protein